MNVPEIDRALSNQDEILPSSGFAASVMEAVRREATVPPPIPFPWKRAMPGLMIAAFVLTLVAIVGIATIAELVRGSLAAHLSNTPAPILPPFAQGTIGTAVGYTGLVLLLTFISVKLSMRLAAGRA